MKFVSDVEIKYDSGRPINELDTKIKTLVKRPTDSDPPRLLAVATPNKNVTQHADPDTTCKSGLRCSQPTSRKVDTQTHTRRPDNNKDAPV